MNCYEKRNLMFISEISLEHPNNQFSGENLFLGAKDLDVEQAKFVFMRIDWREF